MTNMEIRTRLDRTAQTLSEKAGHDAMIKAAELDRWKRRARIAMAVGFAAGLLAVALLVVVMRAQVRP